MNKLNKISIGTFNFIKGIAMITVILGHMLSYYNFGNIISSFPLNLLAGILKSGVIPLFFLISGFGFKERPVKITIKKTFSECIIPYIIVMILVTIFFPIFHYASYKWWPGAVTETIKYSVAFLLGIPKPGKKIFGLVLYWNSAVWFFLAFFIAQNLLNLLFKVKNEYIRNSAILLIICIGYGLLRIDFNYFCIPQGFLAMGFCYIGYLIKKYKFFTATNNKIMWCFIIVVVAFQSVYGDFSLGYGVFKHGFFSCIGATCAGILLMFVGLYFSDVNNFLWNRINSIGVYSFWIMCIHSIELTCIPWYRLPEIIHWPNIMIFLFEIIIKAFIMISGCSLLKMITKLKYQKRLANGK